MSHKEGFFLENIHPCLEKSLLYYYFLKSEICFWSPNFMSPIFLLLTCPYHCRCQFIKTVIFVFIYFSFFNKRDLSLSIPKHQCLAMQNIFKMPGLWIESNKNLKFLINIQKYLHYVYCLPIWPYFNTRISGRYVPLF